MDNIITLLKRDYTKKRVDNVITVLKSSDRVLRWRNPCLVLVGATPAPKCHELSHDERHLQMDVVHGRHLRDQSRMASGTCAGRVGLPHWHQS